MGNGRMAGWVGAAALAAAGVAWAARRRNPADSLPHATAGDTLAFIGSVIAPTLAKGVIIRRYPMVHLAERFELDTKAVRTVDALARRHGRGPLLFRVAGRRHALLLSAEDALRVLAETPDPFTPASDEKRAALGHFEPEGALVSMGQEREIRRAANEAALEAGRRVHSLAPRLLTVVDEEADRLLAGARHAGELAGPAFHQGWMRLVRRVVFGDAAADDKPLTELMDSLRRDGNWAFFKPRRHAARRRLHTRIGDYLARGEPGSLAAQLARAARPGAAPEQQVPQWLFAFDPAGMAVFRALALVATHHEARRRLLAEPDTPQRPFARALVLEALRLWPTTPLILRQTTRPTRWATGMLGAGAGVILFANGFHRHPSKPWADRLAPELWDRPEGPADWPLVPFSDGPAVCPGRELVLMLTSAMLARLAGCGFTRLADAPFDAAAPLPGTLDNMSLRFLEERAALAA